jgi:3-deoxy-D-manno-octulosonate 8-phosphate phosphatase (KDO 8-P phosphatase)
VEEIHQGVDGKLVCLEEMAARRSVELADVAFVADDLPDLEVLLRVGFPIAVANARDEIRRAAKFVTSLTGGNGAVREAIEWVLRLDGKWDALVSRFAPCDGKGDTSGQA